MSAISSNGRPARIAAAALAGLLLAACAGTPVSDRLTAATPAGLPVRAELTETPFFPQTRYHCGPAAMAAALQASGRDADPVRLADKLFTPGRQGTLQSDVIAAARRSGRLAVPIDGMEAAFRTVADGRPVLILQNLALEMAPQWHYALLVGYDLDAGEAMLRSGTVRRKIVPLETLEHTWRRGGFWGRAVVPPEGPIPSAARLPDWMREAAGLERVGDGAAAARAYRSAAAHWRHAAEPLLALANLSYDAGDLAATETALRQAVARAPENGAALNNLAHVLMERGRLADAEAVAERAVAAGGPHQAAARRTLDAIRAR